MKASGIQGPAFITIGEADQLKIFLENNPKVPKELIFVDETSLQAYNAMGLGQIFENKEKTAKGGLKFKPPRLGGFGEWKKYLLNVGRVTPRGSTNQEIIKKVSKLGATYGVSGDKIVYTYEEGVPGDNPDINAVLSAVKAAK